MPAEKTPGRIAYDAYGNSRSWKTANGGDMPRWDDQRPELCTAWAEAAEAVIIATHALKAWRIDDDYRTVVAAHDGETAAAWYAEAAKVDRSKLYAEPEQIEDGEVIAADEDGSPLTVRQLLLECEHWPCLLAQAEV